MPDSSIVVAGPLSLVVVGSPTVVVDEPPGRLVVEPSAASDPSFETTGSLHPYNTVHADVPTAARKSVRRPMFGFNLDLPACSEPLRGPVLPMNRRRAKAWLDRRDHLDSRSLFESAAPPPRQHRRPRQTKMLVWGSLIFFSCMCARGDRAACFTCSYHGLSRSSH